MEQSRESLSRQMSFTTRLSHQPSKLDLIDDTTLTSLPLPPPPSRSRNRTNTIESKRDSDSNSSKPYEQCSPDLNTKPEYIEDESFFDEEESEDPIVLVEDYMKPGEESTPTTMTSLTSTRSAGTTETKSSVSSGSNNTHLHRKQSLATFKVRLQQQQLSLNQESDLVSISDSSSSTTTSIVDPLTFSRTSSASNKYKCSSTLEHFEEVFGKIPGTDNLKYCDLCDKPLYEISAIIEKRRGYIESSKDSENEEIKYQEFVCEECVETYDQFFNELEELNLIEDTNAHEQKMKNNRICEIFKEIERKYSGSTSSDITTLNQITTPSTNKRCFDSADETDSKRTKFSENLLSRLHNLSENDISYNCAGGKRGKFTADGEWIKNIQNKLRWRWRLQGLLPDVLTKQHSIK
ncbi:hypothetical protein CLIB1423_06S05952 [[Candida] railenensis]|uniref:Uncharacterized protein n=1 Tax=[Candida] railenensis TaxID=45579 RepID=A0A9P0VY03_9ASCO|nr:hypothetical protein CLIB1423_06S05952 [[Candida] railenensis]